MKIFWIMIITLIACSGCSMKIHRAFEFTSPEIRFDAGVIHARLRGTMENLDKNTSVNHAPYEMLVWFNAVDAENLLGCTVSLKSITLKNLETSVFLPIPKTDSASFRQNSDGNFIASTNYANLDIGYADHKLEFYYSFDKGCELAESISSVSMEFKTKYSERNISFWDVLLGV